jgi:2-oxoglutarate dehydrogenase E1 component
MKSASKPIPERNNGQRLSPLSAVTPAYLEELEERYRSDPESIDVGWRRVFDLVQELEGGSNAFSAGVVMALLRNAHRDHGHLAATLDPLGTKSGDHLDFTMTHADAAARLLHMWKNEGETGVANWLRSIYTGRLAVETGHIDDYRLREWIHAAMESASSNPDDKEKRRAFELLVAAEEFERFMSVKFPTKKRFGAEGAESLIPLLDKVLSDAASRGVTSVVIGAMHRGRLNIMANILGKSLIDIISEFKGAHPFSGTPDVAADVPYHLGGAGRLLFGNHSLDIMVLPNPSHLEAVNPIVLGRVRARQDQTSEAKKILGIIIHTDASVVAQGIVSEGLQLSGVAAHTTEGTIHIVVNNQIGFTTEEAEARTSRYCTGPWKAIDSLILHANADDLAAVLKAASLAVDFRQSHGRDVVVDLVCYRRNGHNELDEPRFTQPLKYRAIDTHPTAVQLASRTLFDEDQSSTAKELASQWQNFFKDAYEKATAPQPGAHKEPVALDKNPIPREVTHPPATGLPLSRLQSLLAALSSLPDNVTVDPKIERIVRQRGQSATKGVPWPVAEALALGSLLLDGVNVRLTGQDVVRGAFSHRHFAITDAFTGHQHITLNHLSADQGRFGIFNSPLSEYAVLGFEYGYSLERPDDLIIWEAQFGDFANGAQIMIDQFVCSAAEKWQQYSGLVLLLPHGLEGQGPEHSSARPERFLQLAARNNLQIANPTTPANYFHLLRMQPGADPRIPLIVFSTKSLLRHSAAVSAVDDFGPGTAFQPVLTTASAGAIKHVIICSGKIAYDLEAKMAEAKVDDVAIVRMEMLYPFPADELLEVFKKWPRAKYTWAQEEPRNMGAWSYVDRRIEEVLKQVGANVAGWSCVSRPESPSPAGGFHSSHDDVQRQVVTQAFSEVR